MRWRAARVDARRGGDPGTGDSADSDLVSGSDETDADESVVGRLSDMLDRTRGD
jgi:hypothetical protein